MGRYREKSKIFEAYQVGSGQDKESWPQWLYNAFKEGKLLRDGDGRWYVPGTGYPVKVGSWIINSTDGIYSRSEESFNSLYEKVDDEPKQGPQTKKAVDPLEPMKRGYGVGVLRGDGFHVVVNDDWIADYVNTKVSFGKKGVKTQCN